MPPSPWPTSAVDGAPRWVSGLLAAVQAAALSLLTVVVPAVAAFVATSADPVNADGAWWRAAGIGTGLWLLGHGVSLVADGAPVTLVPLGITVLACFACYASARRSARVSWSGWGAGVAGYTAVVVLIAVLSRPAGSPGARLLVAALGAAGLAAAGLGAGMLARPGAPTVADLTRAGWSRLPPLARTGATAGVVALAVVVGASGLLTAGWIITGRERTAEVLTALSGDAVSNVVLVVSQLAVLPNLALWAVAWLAGPGFSVGAETLYSPAAVVPAPLPAVPLLGALPEQAGGVQSWAPAVVVLAGTVAGWYLHRRWAGRRWWEPCVGAWCGAAVAGVGAGLLVLAASGAVGPGRMTQVGASATAVGLLVFVEVAVGMLIVAVPLSRPVRAAVTRRSRRVWYRLRGAGSPASRGDRSVGGDGPGGDTVAV